MNKKLTLLAERREYLAAQAAAQRIMLAQSLEPWRAPLALADRGVAALRYIRSHPALLLGTAFVIAVLRPGRTARWLGRVWGVWQISRRLFRN